MNIHDVHSSDKKIEQTAYDYSFTSLNGNTKINLLDFKGKVILIVNTASKCGLNSQYADLEKIYKDYKDKGLIIIGVPSNDFGGQEPGSHQEIASFCQMNYGVSFIMTQKEKVSGNNAHPFYVWAKKVLAKRLWVFGTAPQWNFHKYLINRQGNLVNYFYPTTSPQSNRFKKAIEKALKERSETAPQ